MERLPAECKHRLELFRLELLLCAGQDGFKMGRLLFAGNDADLDPLETSRFEPAMQITLGKTEPAVAIQLVRPFETVPGEVENHHLSARLQNVVCAADCFGRVLSMMQCLAHDHQIHALRLYRRIL